MNIPMQLIDQYMAIFLNFSPTSNHLHLLQDENCDSISRLVVDEGDNDNFRPERVKRVNRLESSYRANMRCVHNLEQSIKHAPYK